MQALNEKGFNLHDPENKVILCGDAFDRGNQSKEMFQFLKELASQDRLIYILGNHEDLLFECLADISHQDIPGSHHFSNGTVKTICDISDVDQSIMFQLNDERNVKILYDGTEELRAFIREHGRDYFTLGDKIFVHSWLPCYFGELCENWESLEPGCSLWRRARWGNPFDQWELKLYPSDRTVVFGHWHCSWGWSHIRQKHKEFPGKNRKDWQKSFEPFIDDGIIAIDACTAFSGFVNCVVFDENGNLLL